METGLSEVAALWRYTTQIYSYYRSMHYSAKRGIAILHVVCQSVRLSVCLQRWWITIT